MPLRCDSGAGRNYCKPTRATVRRLQQPPIKCKWYSYVYFFLYFGNAHFKLLAMVEFVIETLINTVDFHFDPLIRFVQPVDFLVQFFSRNQVVAPDGALQSRTNGVVVESGSVDVEPRVPVAKR